MMRQLPARLLACLTVWLLSELPGPAWAQLSLPGRASLPSIIPSGGVPLNLRGLPHGVTNPLAAIDLTGLRHEAVETLLRRRRDTIEPDPAGEPAIRSEVLVTAPSAALLQAAASAGFHLLREQNLDGLDLRMVILRPPPGVSTANAVSQLRAMDPEVAIDFNHVYTGSGAVTTPAIGTRAARAGSTSKEAQITTATADAAAAAAAGRDPAPGRVAPVPIRIGLIDSGIDTDHAAFRNARIAHWGCDGKTHPDAHGTAVASLMIGSANRFRGVMPGATLYAADVYCGQPAGGATDAIVAAFSWLAQQRAGVVNVSLVGPANRVLEAAVRAMQKRGHLIVAAVGNDGPAAPALYPASYPGVIGVTAVDGRDRVLPEAARGTQVIFAAPGADMLAASTETGGYAPVRGTSFAAPIVAALLAEALPVPDATDARAARDRLAAEAMHAQGGTIRTTQSPASTETGYGVVGTAFRVAPSRLR